jgi:hypothetical protein
VIELCTFVACCRTMYYVGRLVIELCRVAFNRIEHYVCVCVCVCVCVNLCFINRIELLK